MQFRFGVVDPNLCARRQVFYAGAEDASPSAGNKVTAPQTDGTGGGYIVSHEPRDIARVRPPVL
jgi:hypothetical protein